MTTTTGGAAEAATLAERLRLLRTRAMLTQEQLAERAHLSVRTVRNLEAGRIRRPRAGSLRLLADALGLTEAERGLLADLTARHPDPDPETVTAPPASRPRPPRLPQPPRLLPPMVADFTGRHQQLTTILGLLDQEGGPRPVVVSGSAGVGKTALAVHAAHTVAGRFTDGQLFVNLRGHDPAGPLEPAQALVALLYGLGVAPERIPADPGAQADLYRTLLADKRMLVVLDNARDPDQVRPLLPGAPGCLVLVTSRNRLTGLIAAEGAHPLLLDLLTPGEARDLLTRRLGPTRAAAEPDTVDELITRCARLPLALVIAAANAATHPHLPLTALADQLRRSRDRLDVLSTGDTPATDARAVFSWSYQALTPEAARLFRLLGLHPGPDISTAAAASLAALPTDRVWSLLTQLANANLITEHTPGRYTFHDLLRAYAADLARTTDPDQQRHAATGRMLDHYLHTAYAAARLLDPARDPITLTQAQPGLILEHHAGHEQAFEWFTTEHAVLLAAVDHAAATGFDTHTWQLAWTLDDFLDRRGHWHQWVAAQHAAVAAAGRLADSPAQARSYRSLAQAYARLGRFDEAHTQLLHALDLTTQTGDLTEQAHTHHSLAWVCDKQGRPGQALDHDLQALNLYQAVGHQRGQARCLNGIGWDHTLLGDHHKALTYCQQALTLLQELDDRPAQAATWDSLGHAHHHLGQHDQALACYGHAIDLHREIGDRHGEADALTYLGDTHHATDNPDSARNAWQQALDILTDLHHPDAHQIRTKLANLDQTTHQNEEDHQKA